MTVSYLPVELWLIIQSFAKYSSNDLTALCLVCTDFYHAVVDSLYNSITVDSCDVCITLAECPRLAQKVRSFTFTYPRLIADDQSPKVNLGNLTLALKNMINLSTLKLIHSPQRYSSVLRHCYAELHIFHCTYCIDRQFLRFLNRQDNIRDLAVTCHYHWADDIQPKRFPRRSLPHLTQVSASYEWLRAFVPGRPVHTVRVKGEHLFSRHMPQLSPIAILSRSTVPVRNLGIDLMTWPELSSTELGAEHAEEITLTGFAVRQLRKYSGLRKLYWMQNLHSVLAGMPNLKRLTFWMEGRHEHARMWAGFLFREFDNDLSRLEQASCAVAEPGMVTVVDYFKEWSRLDPVIHVDNRTRGHRAAHDVRELMPFPILCCWSGGKLCHEHTFSLELDILNFHG